MSRVVFIGNQAGTIDAVVALLRAKQRGVTLSGDTNAVHNYVLMCGCDEGRTELGNVQGFLPNALGERSVACGKCSNVTLLDKHLKVMKVLPLAKVLALQNRS